MTQTVNWIFGRGVSIGCNLSWGVPSTFSQYSREEKIGHIKAALRVEVQRGHIDTSSLASFLSNLSSRTSADWRHRIITTNWDILLETEIAALGLADLPKWLADSYVYHLNGTIEEHASTTHLSPFLLEEDGYAQRTQTTEANRIFSYLVWSRVFIVIGMSFECETDRFLLGSLRNIEDEMPIGESTWIVLNPDASALAASSSRIATALPRAKVYSMQIDFKAWIDEGMAPLSSIGVFSF
ncbi:MAG: hypothetical protein Q8S94_00445 [Pseudohongiella sp.]|nr:hypothetical protein [Pseudohongiella sp.]